MLVFMILNIRYSRVGPAIDAKYKTIKVSNTNMRIESIANSHS